jgi:hypothetical protein
MQMSKAAALKSLMHRKVRESGTMQVQLSRTGAEDEHFGRSGTVLADESGDGRDSLFLSSIMNSMSDPVSI